MLAGGEVMVPPGNFPNRPAGQGAFNHWRLIYWLYWAVCCLLSGGSIAAMIVGAIDGDWHRVGRAALMVAIATPSAFYWIQRALAEQCLRGGHGH